MRYLQGYPLPIVSRGGDENEGNLEIANNLGETWGWSGRSWNCASSSRSCACADCRSDVALGFYQMNCGAGAVRAVASIPQLRRRLSSSSERTTLRGGSPARGQDLSRFRGVEGRGRRLRDYRPSPEAGSGVTEPSIVLPASSPSASTAVAIALSLRDSSESCRSFLEISRLAASSSSRVAGMTT